MTLNGQRSLATCSEIPLADRRLKLASHRHFHGQVCRTQNHVYYERGDGAGLSGVHPDRLVVGVNGFAGISFAWMGLRRGDRAAGGESSTLSRLTTLTGCMDGVGSDIRLLVTRAGIGTSAMRPFATCQHGLPKRW